MKFLKWLLIIVLIFVTLWSFTEKTKYPINKIMDYIALNKLMITGEAFEFYLTEPVQEPDITKWQTHIAFPLK